VPRLADVQAGVRRTVTGRAPDPAIVPLLVGGLRPERRLAIHARHYAASLTAAIANRFPACGWLIGAAALEEAAAAFVREQPPSRPCLAEYGEAFPQFLMRHPASEALVCLPSFAALEWAAGEVSIAISEPAATWHEVAALDPEALADARLGLQPGIRFVVSRWPVHELMQMYLRDTAPAEYVLREEPTFVQVSGARGALSLGPLDQATFAFRRALSQGFTVTHAAEVALDDDPQFDAGAALAALVAAGLVAAVNRSVR
jgi:hypothetical protein